MAEVITARRPCWSIRTGLSGPGWSLPFMAGRRGVVVGVVAVDVYGAGVCALFGMGAGAQHAGDGGGDQDEQDEAQ